VRWKSVDDRVLLLVGEAPLRFGSCSMSGLPAEEPIS
jgi:hypothetical protein